MYQEMLSNGDYNNWSEYCSLVDAAREEYEEEIAREEYEQECAREEYEKELLEKEKKRG